MYKCVQVTECDFSSIFLSDFFLFYFPKMQKTKKKENINKNINSYIYNYIQETTGQSLPSFCALVISHSSPCTLLLILYTLLSAHYSGLLPRLHMEGVAQSSMQTILFKASSHPTACGLPLTPTPDTLSSGLLPSVHTPSQPSTQSNMQAELSSSLRWSCLIPLPVDFPLPSSPPQVSFLHTLSHSPRPQN